MSTKPFITPPSMPVMPPRPLPPGEVEIRLDHGVLSYVVRDLAHIAVAFAVARELESLWNRIASPSRIG